MMLENKLKGVVVFACAAVPLTANLAIARPTPEKDIADRTIAAQSFKTLARFFV